MWRSQSRMRRGVIVSLVGVAVSLWPVLGWASQSAASAVGSLSVAAGEAQFDLLVTLPSFNDDGLRATFSGPFVFDGQPSVGTLIVSSCYIDPAQPDVRIQATCTGGQLAGSLGGQQMTGTCSMSYSLNAAETDLEETLGESLPVMGTVSTVCNGTLGVTPVTFSPKSVVVTTQTTTEGEFTGSGHWVGAFVA